MTKIDLWKFHKYITKLSTGNQYQDPPEFHKKIINHYQSKDRLVAIICPVGFAKSTTAKSFLIYELLTGQDIFILYATSTGKKVSDQFTGISKILNDPMLRQIFKYEIKQENTTSITIQFDNGTKKRVQGVSNKQGIAGINFENNRPTLIIIDDIEELDTAESIYQTEKIIAWIQVTLLSRLPSQTKGRVRLIGTNLTRNSIVNRILNNIPSRSGEKVFNKWVKYKYSALDENNQSIWEERHTTEGLIDYKLSNPIAYASNYDNAPLDSSQSILKLNDIQYYNTNTRPPIVSCTIHADLAQTGSNTSDYYCIGIIAKCTDNRYYLLDFIIAKMDYMQQIYTTIKFYLKYKSKPIINFTYDAVANDGFELIVKKVATEEFDLSIPIQPHKTPKDKVQTFNQILPTFLSHRILFNSDIENFDLLITQLLYFPNEKNDDAVDMISNALSFYEVPNQKELNAVVISQEELDYLKGKEYIEK